MNLHQLYSCGVYWWPALSLVSFAPDLSSRPLSELDPYRLTVAAWFITAGRAGRDVLPDFGSPMGPRHTLDPGEGGREQQVGFPPFTGDP